MLTSSGPAGANLEVMTDQELRKTDGGFLIQMGVSDDDFYGVRAGGAPHVGGAHVTVVRFASDIYIENYGTIGALKMGHYGRDIEELGHMASMDSNYTIVYGPQSRVNPEHDALKDASFAAGHIVAGRYSNHASGVTLGAAVRIRARNPLPGNFGSTLASLHPETQWDVNWEQVQLGVSEDYPMRMYGLVLRAEFDNWGTENQRLRRFVIGSNNVYGYAQARPLVTSGWLNSEMAKVNPETSAETNQAVFQLKRDPFMDQYWSLSSFNLDPDTPGSEGSFRQFWFNTNMGDVTTDGTTLTNLVGRYQDKSHGFFLSVDVTDRRFSGWNLIGGVSEYRDWPPFEQSADRFFENKFHGAPGYNPQNFETGYGSVW